jgi:hypothetical protein
MCTTGYQVLRQNGLPRLGFQVHMSSMPENPSTGRYLEVRVADVIDSCSSSDDAVVRPTPSVTSATPNRLVELLAATELTDLHDDQIMLRAWSR